ncbi:MAG TPA: hypothetical protein VE619_07315 [Nitrososphaeraceae archaeon]|nr:hypothetical protein [Nitrososphaeraceae archaeon]
MANNGKEFLLTISHAVVYYDEHSAEVCGMTSCSSPSKNFASIRTKDRVIVVMLSLAIVFFEVVPMNSMVYVSSSTTSSSPLSTIKPLKTMNGAKANDVVASY